ncbi:tetratricopeptide repeat protein [Geotalea sp. SG265]|uniref:tetratricopeptide repeat protein n=1 Tax=Geotalea sp. SG265 TaxID=2922867 RepID=UPI001FAF1256|nr:tetratricopeptide repeat protein [Geotalea sp. SG265]
MKKYSTIMIIAFAPVFLCGFDWGFGIKDKCTEAKKLATELNEIKDDASRGDSEAKIAELCPEGAAVHFARALNFERNGALDKAIAEYQESLREDSDFAAANGNLGLAYLKKKQEDDAVVELTKATKNHSSGIYHKALGKIFSDKKLYSLALYHYNEALAQMPADTGLHADIADVYLNSGLPNSAEEEFNKILVAESGNTRARMGIAAINSSRNDFDKAIDQLKKAQAVDPGNKEIHRLLAEAYDKKGDKKSAEYESLLAGVQVKTETAARPDHLRQGDAFMAAKEFPKAIDEYKAALKEKPDWPEVLQKLGDASMAVDNDDDAITYYKEAVRLKAKDDAIHYKLGLLYERQALLDEAVVEYRQYLSAVADNLDARRRLADIYTQRGSYPQAIEQYRALLKLKSDDAAVHLKLARVYVSSKDYAPAITEYLEATKLEPGNIEAHRELALLYRKKNQNDEAAKEYQAVLKVKKDDNDARTALTSIYVKGKKYDELIDLLKEGVELNPKDPNSHYKLGLMYEFKKDYPAAIDQYKEATVLKADHAKALNALGRAYMKSGRITEAKEALEAAKKADPELEETTVLLSNIKDEMSPEPKKYKKRSHKSKKSKSARKSGKSRSGKTKTKKSRH